MKSFTGKEIISELDGIFKELVQRNKKDYILGKKGTALCRVEVPNVLFIETTRRGCRAVVTSGTGNTEKEEIALSDNIDQIENDYVEFARIHKSFLVNLSRVAEVDKSEVVLEDGTVITASRPYQKQIKEKYRLKILMPLKKGR